jgi:hypothetical protein
MNYQRLLAIAIGSAVIASSPARAVDVDFTATLAGTCTVSVPTTGVMALNGDGTVLGSEEATGVAATLSILAIGSATVTVGDPTLTVTADALNYDATNETIEVRYTGAGGLGVVDQAYTDAETSFNISTTPSSLLTLHGRATNPDSFDAGTYRLRTVVTCS